MRVLLTNGDPTVGTGKVDVRLGDGSHADLIIGPGEEGGECAGKCYSSVPGGTTNGNTDLESKAFFF